MADSNPRQERPQRRDDDGEDVSAWPAAALRRIQQILDDSRASAGAAVRETFDRPQRRMDAREFVAFWNACKMKAMSTVGGEGTPHIAPVHAAFVDGRLRTTIYVDAVRRRDLDHNPNVAMTTWGEGGAAAILYGTASELAGSERDTRPGASGRGRRTVTLEIEVTRIYAMKPRPATASE